MPFQLSTTHLPSPTSPNQPEWGKQNLDDRRAKPSQALFTCPACTTEMRAIVVPDCVTAVANGVVATEALLPASQPVIWANVRIRDPELVQHSTGCFSAGICLNRADSAGARFFSSAV